ncbi:MAG: radical SAM protein, partial [Deltaproteobacteria bacterium]
NTDHFCREEGVRFMRRLLNDEPVDRPITQYHLPFSGFTAPGFASRHVRVPTILVSLGCPNACEFCNTSAFFYHKKIYVAEPGEVYDFMKNYQRRLRTKDIMVILFDEDFFLNPEYVRELGRLIRSSRDTWGIRYFTFTSMRSISQFEPEELRECGVGSVWIGVESSYSEVVENEHGYAKRAGKEMREVFEGLQRYGIQTVASMILGFDFHTRENIEEDIDYFVGLKPTFYQVAPLTPCPGTPFYGRMVEEERIYEDYGWDDYHIWKDDVFKIKNFERGEIRKYYDLTHEKLAEENGPPILQMLEGSLEAYEIMKDSSDEFLQFQAQESKRLAHGLQTVLKPIKTMAPSKRVRQRAEGLEKKYRELIGKPPFLVKQISRLVNRRFEKAAQNPPPKPLISDPLPRWTYYNHGGGPTPLVRKGRKSKKAVPYKDKSFFVGAG